MERITTPSGATVSYDTYGSGPPLVLVHGGFSDHDTNWQEVKPLLRDRFTVYAVARRGRGVTSATRGHTVAEEAADVAAVLRQVGEPAFLLGHSYGAVCALEAAALYPAGVRKLVLYEPPFPHTFSADTLAGLEAFAAREDWDGLV
jgi:pimeloyl-ACP methyl ester carboxylesterase